MPYYDYADHRETCAHCGTRLAARQEMWCGERCRSAARSAARRPLRRVVCELCGEVFVTQNSRKKRCALASGVDPESPRYADRHAEADRVADAGPDDPCWELQEAELREEREAENARDFPTCAHCGEGAEYWGTGRHRKYCSDKCRVYAYRARKGRKAAHTATG